MYFGGGGYLVGDGHSGALTLLQAEEVASFFRLPLFEKEKSEPSAAGAAGQSLACLRSQSHRRGNSGGPRNLPPHRSVISTIVHIVCKCTSGEYKHSHPGTLFTSLLPTSGGNTAWISAKLLKIENNKSNRFLPSLL